MRKFQKDTILDFISTLEEAHNCILEFINNNEKNKALLLIGDCQNNAIYVGEHIEEEKQYDFIVSLMEDYCENLYHLYTDIDSDTEININKEIKKLNKQIWNIKDKVKYEIKVKLEVAFLPYNASMWGCLESIWKAAVNDEDCNVNVVPIPYFERNKDFSFGKKHYEGELLPEYVPIIDYKNYDIRKEKPDIIFIHNPFDGNNLVTSVDSFYYSDNLKKYTDKLIYVPYFVTGDNIGKTTCMSIGIFNSDYVIVETEGQKKVFINNILSDYSDEKEIKSVKEIFDNKLLAFGNPLDDKLKNTNFDDIDIPSDWKKIIYDKNNKLKRIVLYNVSIGDLLKSKDIELDKIERVLKKFKDRKDEIALLFRPHPLIISTIESMCPDLFNRYMSIINNYRDEKWGIYDDTPDMYRAIVMSDFYYGDFSAVAHLCKRRGIPVMRQNQYIE